MSPRNAARSCDWPVFVFGSLFLLHAVMAAAAAAAPAVTPVAQSPALESLISASMGRSDAAFAFAAAGGSGYAVTMRGGATATIRDGGLAVAAGGRSWALAPASIGRDGSLLPLAARPAPTVRANRVEFGDDRATAWYVNGPAGLEQGWTVRRRPSGRGDLRIAMRLGGDLRPTIAADGRSVALAASGEAVLRYGGLAAYDARGRDLPARFALDHGDLVVRVGDAGATYPLTVDPFVQSAKLVASDGGAKFYLGSSVAISSDGSTIAVAAPGASVAGRDAQGIVYVFVRPAGGWANGTQAAELTASDGQAGDYLGTDAGGVAVSADGSTVVAAAPYATIGTQEGQGAAYVFLRPGAIWASIHETAKLTASDGLAGDNLGCVTVSGDGSTIVGGAFDATVGANSFQGAAYLFQRSPTGWMTGVQKAKLTAADGAKDNGFGGNVAVSADGATLAVGASGATIGGRRAQGAVYVFAMPAGGWASGSGAQVAKLTATDGEVDYGLGDMTALSGDGSTVVAGANGTTILGHTLQGAAYVFVKPASGWTDATQTAELTESDGAAHDEFGYSVAIDGDGTTVLGGAGNATVAGHAQQGAAYVFVRPAAGWSDTTEAAKMTAADGVAKDLFGTVAVSADGATVAVTAEFATVAAQPMEGAAYVFSGSGCISGATTLCLDDQPGDRRWQITSSYSTTEGGGSSGKGQAISLATAGVSHGGLFWFFDSFNPEMLIKVLNGCAVDQHFWVFDSAATNVGFQVTVTDTKLGRSKVYSNKDGTAAIPIQDTAAFACTTGSDAAPAAMPAPAPAGGVAAGSGCTTTATSLCIDDRFQIGVHYHTAQGGGSSGDGQAIALQTLGVDQGGLFWFFAQDNPEMLIKVLDGCAVDNKYWVFYAAGTNVAFTVTVTDTTTGKSVSYHNDDQTAAPPVQDTSALPCG